MACFFYMDSFNFSLLQKFKLDYNYLVGANSAFLKAYFGGLFLQFIIILIAAILRLYFSYRSSIVYFVPSMLHIYILNTISLIIFCGFCAWIFMNMSAFGLSGDHSWFQPNPNLSVRGLPLPDNNMIFILSGLLFVSILAIPEMILLVIIEAIKGARISLD